MNEEFVQQLAQLVASIEDEKSHQFRRGRAADEVGHQEGVERHQRLMMVLANLEEAVEVTLRAARE